MLRYTYPSRPWLLDYILYKKINRGSPTLRILKSIAGPFPDGIKMMQVGDGEIFMKAEFSLEASHILDSESEVYWEQSLIKVEDWEMDLVLKKNKETSEYIIRIMDFAVWCDERRLSMVSCNSHPLIRENIARIFEENQRRITPKRPDSNNHDSVSLSILREQTRKDNDNRTPSKNSVMCAIPNGGRMSSVMTERLAKQLLMTNIQDILIHPKDAKILAMIGDDFQVAEKSSYLEANASFILANSSTFKHPSSKIYPQMSSVITPYRNEEHKPNKVASTQPVVIDLTEIDMPAQQVSQQPCVVALKIITGDTSTRQVSQNSPEVAPCSNKRRKLQEATPQAINKVEEEIRPFVLSRTSNEQAKCLPLKVCDKKNKSNDNSKNFAKTVRDLNQAISASNTSNASQVNKDSVETSFEIRLSGKVASNNNLNKLNSDETDSNSFDSLLDASSENRVSRWDNLNLSPIESEAESYLTNKTQMSKKIKLSHAAESTSGPPQETYENCHKLFPKHTACLSLMPSPKQLTTQNNMNGIVLGQKMIGFTKIFDSSSIHPQEKEEN